MAAAELTETTFPLQHLVPLVVKAQRAAASDWVVFNGYKGVVPMGAIGQSIAVSLEDTGMKYGAATVNGTVAATVTSVIMSSAQITRVCPFYCLSYTGEVFEVIADSDETSATPTWTINRGCLGTTAAALTNADVVSILNIVILPANNVGPCMMVVLPLPEDNKAKLLA